MSASACLLQPPSPSAHFAEESFEQDSNMDVDALMLEQEKLASTAIIFDWDDTLLPSSWLSARDLRLDFPTTIPQDMIDELAQHEVSVCALLSKAVERGEVIIITNAENGWVELSAQRFLPKVAKLLEAENLTVLSARSTYEPAYPDNPFAWKLQAFHQQIKECFDGAHTQKSVISFGDSVHERDAVHKVVGAMQKAFTKSVKFVERPSLEQLRREVELIRSCLDYICTCHQDLDLMLTIQLLYN